MKRSKLGLELEEGLRQAVAHSRGEIELPSRVVDVMPAARVKAIRKAVARNPKDFERRFGIPARTLEGWEQGRRQPDPTARALLRVIEADPAAVERALEKA